jgi:hypothetical protein
MKLKSLLGLFAFVGLLGVIPARADQVQIGKRIVVEEGQSGGDLVCVGCSIVVRGTAGDIVSVGGRVDISGRTTGDVVVVGGSVNLASTAAVKGDVVTVGGRLNREPGATVTGEVSETGGGAGILGLGIVGIALLFLLPALLFGFILALVVYAIMGEPRIQTIAATITWRTGHVLTVGLVAVAVFIGVCAIYAHVGHSGGMVVLIVVAAFGGLLMVGYTGVSYWVGTKVSPGGSGMTKVLVGALIVTGLQLIPIVNIVAVIFALMALGAPVVSGFGTQPVMTTAPPPPVAAAR